MLAGLGAGMMEAIIAVTPSETIKTKMIEDSKRVDGPRFKGLVHGVKMIVKEEGYRGVYRGVGPVVSCSSLHSLLLECSPSITRRSHLRVLFSEGADQRSADGRGQCQARSIHAIAARSNIADSRCCDKAPILLSDSPHTPLSSSLSRETSSPVPNYQAG